MEKRLYKRIVVRLIGNFIVLDNNPGLREFSGVISDICENGIKISISDESFSHIVQSIEIGSKIAFQAIDEYEMYGEDRTDIFSGESEVIRIENEGESTIIGCKMTKSSTEFDEYVKNKKMSLYMESGYILP